MMVESVTRHAIRGNATGNKEEFGSPVLLL